MNHFTLDEDRAPVMLAALQRAETIVAFTESQASLCRAFLSSRGAAHVPRLRVVPQSTDVAYAVVDSPELLDLVGGSSPSGSLRRPPRVLLLPAGLRPIKRPDMLIEPFACLMRCRYRHRQAQPHHHKWSCRPAASEDGGHAVAAGSGSVGASCSCEALLVLIGPRLDGGVVEAVETAMRRCQAAASPPDASSDDADCPDRESACPVHGHCPVVLLEPVSRSVLLHWLASSQVAAVLNSSDAEGMPNAVLEAMALGVPVLCRDVPGNRDVVESGRVGGWLWRDEADFSKQCDRLLDTWAGTATEPLDIDRVVAAGARFVAERFSLDAERAAWHDLVCAHDR